MAIYSFIIAAFELSRYIQKLTRFTHEIFACFVCSIYIVNGIPSQNFSFSNPEKVFELLLTIIQFVLCMWLTTAISWKTFSPAVRGFLTDYGVTLAVLITTGFSYALPNDDVKRIVMPSLGVPTF